MESSLQRGTLKSWKGDRGFGFIKPSDGSPDVFLHISAVRKAVREPQIGDTILYSLSLQPDGRVRAVNASIQGVALLPAPQRTSRNKTDSSKAELLPHKNLYRPFRAALVMGIVTSGLISAGVFKRIPDSTASTPTTPSNSSALRSAVAPDCVIKGNISWNSGSKYYHTPGMEDYVNTQIDLERGERWFCTEQEALSSGWVKAPTR